MTKEEILQDIGKLRSALDVRDAKYRRNYNRYANAGVRRDDIRSFYGQPFGMWQRASDDDTSPIPINQLIKSAIDTHISKMSQTKVRPFFTPVNGEYKTRKGCRAAQQFFDELYEKQDVHMKAINCLRAAEIFDTGNMWVDERTGKIVMLLPFEVYVDAAEVHYGKLTRCFIRRTQYPIEYLIDDIKEGTDAYTLYKQYRGAKCENVEYYDLKGKRRYTFVNADIVKESAIDSDVCPIAFMWYTQPVSGARTTGLCDDLLPLQLTHDMVSQRIKDAFELTPANSVFLPTGAGFKGSMMSTGSATSMSIPPGLLAGCPW